MEKDLWGNARRYQGKEGNTEMDKTRTLKEALKNRLAFPLRAKLQFLVECFTIEFSIQKLPRTTSKL